MTDLVIPNSFSAGDPASATEMNANFAAVVARVNGGLNADNLSTPYFQSTVVIPTPNVQLTSGTDWVCGQIIHIPTGQVWYPVQVTLWQVSHADATIWLKAQVVDDAGTSVSGGTEMLGGLTYDSDSGGDNDAIYNTSTGSVVHTTFALSSITGPKDIYFNVGQKGPFGATASLDYSSGITFTYKQKLLA